MPLALAWMNHNHTAPDFDAAYDDESRLEPTVPFPMDEVLRDFGEAEPDSESPLAMSADELRKFQSGLERVIRWIYQDPKHLNMDGIAIRAVIVAWIVIKELQPLTLTELARHYGKDKQSLGRWVEEFKERFPGVRNVHMK